MGLNDTWVCECGQDIEDVDDYFFKCRKYESIRRVLLQSVQDILSDGVHCQSSKLNCFSVVVALAVRRYISESTFTDTCGYLSIYTSVSTSALSHTVLFFSFHLYETVKNKKEEFSNDLSRADYHSMAKDLFSLFSSDLSMMSTDVFKHSFFPRTIFLTVHILVGDQYGAESRKDLY